MSRTISDLVLAGLILTPEVDLGPRRLPNRRLFVSKQLDVWRRQLSTQQPQRALLSERAEIDAIFAEFVAGQPMTNLLDCYPPVGEGIRKIKTPRFRLWGWSPAAQTLVLVLAATKSEIVNGNVKEKDMGIKAHQIRKDLACEEVANGPWHKLFRKA